MPLPVGYANGASHLQPDLNKLNQIINRSALNNWTGARYQGGDARFSTELGGCRRD